MKKTIAFFSVLIFVIILSSCWLMERTIVGEGETVTSEYIVDSATILDVDHISLENHGNSIYSHLYVFDNENKDEHKVILEGQKNIVDSINVKSKSSKLSISGNFYEKYETDLFTIKLYGFTFEEIYLNDVRGSMVSKMEGDNVKFELSGTAYLSCPEFKTKKLNVSLIDASQLVLGIVEAEESIINLANSSSIIISSIDSKKCTAILENSSSITSTFVSDELKLDISGTSKGTVEGNISKVKIEVSGSSKLNGIDLITNYADTNVLGASSLSLNVNTELKAYLNGESTLTYTGECKKSIDASGDATVNHI